MSASAEGSAAVIDADAARQTSGALAKPVMRSAKFASISKHPPRAFNRRLVSVSAAFARRVRAGVEQRFAVRLHPEPIFWGTLSLD